MDGIRYGISYFVEVLFDLALIIIFFPLTMG
jgi:hypothetical protein